MAAPIPWAETSYPYGQQLKRNHKMRQLLTLCFLLCTLLNNAQQDYGTPTTEPLPKKLSELRVAIEVHNFPLHIDAVKISDRYYWKHTTSILCRESEITIIEYGAYLFYNGKWNLRKSYPLKELNKNFGTKKQQLLQAQPYTWINNWRSDSKLYAGWAMWYFIGVTPAGEKVCGYQKIETTNILLNP